MIMKPLSGRWGKEERIMMGIEQVRLLQFQDLQFEAGKQIELACQEENRKGGGIETVPFKIRRVFYMYASDHSVIRGNHANRISEFVLINVHGSSKVRVDDGMDKKIFELPDPRTGLYIPPMIWKEMYDFSQGSVLLCLSSREYDANEYIRDYEAYIRENRYGKF